MPDNEDQIKRTLQLKTKDAPSNLYFRAAAGNIVAKDGGFLVNDELLISVKGSGAGIHNNELRIPIQFRNGTAQLEITYAWVF